MESEKKIVHKIEEGMDPHDVLCTTYQMRNFYSQFRDGFFSQLDVMNYIQHHSAALLCKRDMNVVDVCCGRSLMLPLLRYYSKEINSYTGVDISEANIREAKRGAAGKITEEELESYYPFKVDWILSNVAEMSNHISEGFADVVIYTSALEHMHKDTGTQSLKECYKIMNPNSVMFLSCPNTPGNGYETQYAAHVYEWGYQELKDMLNEIGFEIINEIGLVMKVKKMREFFSSDQVSPEMKNFYKKMESYVPSAWLSAIVSIPYPEQSDEILFVVKKKSNKKRLF
jgi:2-polyprenyl-3-methyl-5-hydroxy-6-metoxy-1,4-benzoquinol methylase